MTAREKATLAAAIWALAAALFIACSMRARPEALIVVIPFVLSLLPVISAELRGMSGVLLGAFCVVGLMSVGIFFAPAAILLLLPVDDEEATEDGAIHTLFNNNLQA